MVKVSSRSPLRLGFSALGCCRASFLLRGSLFPPSVISQLGVSSFSLAGVVAHIFRVAVFVVANVFRSESDLPCESNTWNVILELSVNFKATGLVQQSISKEVTKRL